MRDKGELRDDAYGTGQYQLLGCGGREHSPCRPIVAPPMMLGHFQEPWPMRRAAWCARPIKGYFMTDLSVAARFAESDFRVGRVINRSVAVLSRNFVAFFIVAVVAYLPLVLLERAQTVAATSGDLSLTFILIAVSFVLLIVLSMLSQAVILQAAFRDMRNQPVNLIESLQIGLRRFLPIVGLALLTGILVGLGVLLLIVPGLILYTMWFVGLPACIVERLGPWSSLKRSAELTKGHRWKLFGLLALLMLISLVVSGVTEFALGALAGAIVALIGKLVVSAIWAAFSSVLVAVTYHDLRVAKEGIDIEQIAAVFD